jgi:UDP-2,3-diacylglucosamine pyrophosphatase LpxH
LVLTAHDDTAAASPAALPANPTRHNVRTVFISDVHLGSRECQAEALLDFLGSVQVQTLYLVGDIVDLWSLRKNFYWPTAHNEVLRKIFEKMRTGTRVIFVPGNHDEDFREFVGMVFGEIEVERDCVHETAAGVRLLVLHGDEFDGVVKCSPLLAAIGGWAYDFTLYLNRWFNRARRLFGLPYWSLATYLKERVRNAVDYIANFEHAAARAASRRGLDGVVCGHIHRPEVATIDGLLYCNDGDWVESCTALVEDRNGRLAIWRWSDMHAGLHVAEQAVPALAGARAAIS